MKPSVLTSKRSAAVLGLAIAALAFASVATADKEKVQLTTAGQAAARAAVLKKADFGGAAGWTGGAKKPDLSSTLMCANYHPKQSDLVLIGAAESDWSNSGLDLDSESSVLKTPRMVKLDWQRTVLSPHTLSCLRSSFAKELGTKTRIVSARRIGFPHVATYATSFRIITDTKTSTGSVRVMTDMVLIGRSRTEITMTATAPLSTKAIVRSTEISLARILVSRIRA